MSAELRRIISGQRRDGFAWFARGLLVLASIPYGLVVRWRNRRFDQGCAEQHRVGIPVICVGNLTVGGTGKTPMVAYLCRWYRERGVRVAIVSRGYRAGEQQTNDEARELHERLPDVPHIQNPDRVAAARVAENELAVQVVVLDDGFQHRRLHRDLDIVLIDALQPFGFERLLPRGLLREHLRGLKRAQLVALTRANLVTPEQRMQIRERVASVAPEADWLELAHVPIALCAGEQRQSVSELRGKRVVAFCGLGNPAGFRRTLESCDAKLLHFREFPDHHHYTRQDLESLQAVVAEHRPDFVVCTHKDMVKIELDQIQGVPLRALWVEQQVVSGKAALDDDLNRLLPPDFGANQ